jgi:hypothetical protein
MKVQGGDVRLNIGGMKVQGGSSSLDIGGTNGQGGLVGFNLNPEGGCPKPENVKGKHVIALSVLRENGARRPACGAGLVVGVARSPARMRFALRGFGRRR